MVVGAGGKGEAVRVMADREAEQCQLPSAVGRNPSLYVMLTVRVGLPLSAHPL